MLSNVLYVVTGLVVGGSVAVDDVDDVVSVDDDEEVVGKVEKPIGAGCGCKFM